MNQAALPPVNHNPVIYAGVSLVELMISLTIGLMMLVGLATLFANSSAAQRERDKSAEQIRNARHAMEIIGADLRLAGFFGEFANLPPRPLAQMPFPAALPDPCDTDVAMLLAALPVPVQGYDARNPQLSCLSPANYVQGTDILVVRRAGTALLAPGSMATAGDYYLQANSTTADLQRPESATTLPSPNNPGRKADGSTPATVFRKDGSSGADVRKFHVHIYFIAPCKVPAGGGNDCTGATDDNGAPVPTLKRLELGPGGMRVVPLVEGIANLQIDYGLDENPASTDPSTGGYGDGSPDRFVSDPARAPLPTPATVPPTLNNWQNVVAARIHILARSTRPSPGHSDEETYDMGIAGTTMAAKDAFKRHLYSAQLRLTNLGSRREIPCAAPCL